MLYPWDKGFEPPEHWRNRELADLTEEQFQAAHALTMRTLRKEFWKALARLPIALIKGDRKVTILPVEVKDLWILALPFFRDDEHVSFVDGYSDALVRYLTTRESASEVASRFSWSFRFLDISENMDEARYFIEVPTMELRLRRLRRAIGSRAYFRAKRRSERQLARQSR